MKRVPLILFVFLNTEYWILNTAKAADLGTHGHTFEIQEPDLLKQLEDKLHRLEKEGTLARYNETLIEKAKKAIHMPQPIVGITKATRARTFYYDPSISVPYDLKDHEGRVFQKAGTKINPLKFRSLSSPLIFIDGKDEAQVSWTQKTYLNPNQGSDQDLDRGLDGGLDPLPKIILTSGSPFELMEQWNSLSKNPLSGNQLVGNQLVENQPVYFDQTGKLTKKLGIKHVPAVVTQEGLKLKVSEIALEEGTK